MFLSLLYVASTHVTYAVWKHLYNCNWPHSIEVGKNGQREWDTKVTQWVYIMWFHSTKEYKGSTSAARSVFTSASHAPVFPKDQHLQHPEQRSFPDAWIKLWRLGRHVADTQLKHTKRLTVVLTDIKKKKTFSVGRKGDGRRAELSINSVILFTKEVSRQTRSTSLCSHKTSCYPRLPFLSHWG